MASEDELSIRDRRIIARIKRRFQAMNTMLEEENQSGTQIVKVIHEGQSIKRKLGILSRLYSEMNKINDLLDTTIDILGRSFHLLRELVGIGKTQKILARGKYDIAKDCLEKFYSFGMTIPMMSEVLEVSIHVIRLRLKEFGLSLLERYSELSDAELDAMISSVSTKDCLGYRMIHRALRDRGVVVTVSRVYKAVLRLDPEAYRERQIRKRGKGAEPPPPILPPPPEQSEGTCRYRYRTEDMGDIELSWCLLPRPIIKYDSLKQHKDIAKGSQFYSKKKMTVSACTPYEVVMQKLLELYPRLEGEEFTINKKDFKHSFHQVKPHPTDAACLKKFSFCPKSNLSNYTLCIMPKRDLEAPKVPDSQETATQTCATSPTSSSILTTLLQTPPLSLKEPASAGSHVKSPAPKAKKYLFLFNQDDTYQKPPSDHILRRTLRQKKFKVPRRRRSRAAPPKCDQSVSALNQLSSTFPQNTNIVAGSSPHLAFLSVSRPIKRKHSGVVGSLLKSSSQVYKSLTSIFCKGAQRTPANEMEMNVNNQCTKSSEDEPHAGASSHTDGSKSTNLQDISGPVIIRVRKIHRKRTVEAVETDISQSKVGDNKKIYTGTVMNTIQLKRDFVEIDNVLITPLTIDISEESPLSTENLNESSLSPQSMVDIDEVNTSSVLTTVKITAENRSSSSERTVEDNSSSSQPNIENSSFLQTNIEHSENKSSSLQPNVEQNENNNSLQPDIEQNKDDSAFLQLNTNHRKVQTLSSQPNIEHSNKNTTSLQPFKPPDVPSSSNVQQENNEDTTPPSQPTQSSDTSKTHEERSQEIIFSPSSKLPDRPSSKNQDNSTSSLPPSQSSYARNTQEENNQEEENSEESIRGNISSSQATQSPDTSNRLEESSPDNISKLQSTLSSQRQEECSQEITDLPSHSAGVPINSTDGLTIKQESPFKNEKDRRTNTDAPLENKGPMSENKESSIQPLLSFVMDLAYPPFFHTELKTEEWFEEEKECFPTNLITREQLEAARAELKTLPIFRETEEGLRLLLQHSAIKKKEYIAVGRLLGCMVSGGVMPAVLAPLECAIITNNTNIQPQLCHVLNYDFRLKLCRIQFAKSPEALQAYMSDSSALFNLSGCSSTTDDPDALVQSLIKFIEVDSKCSAYVQLRSGLEWTGVLGDIKVEVECGGTDLTEALMFRPSTPLHATTLLSLFLVRHSSLPTRRVKEDKVMATLRLYLQDLEESENLAAFLKFVTGRTAIPTAGFSPQPPPSISFIHPGDTTSDHPSLTQLVANTASNHLSIPTTYTKTLHLLRVFESSIE